MRVATVLLLALMSFGVKANDATSITTTLLTPASASQSMSTSTASDPLLTVLLSGLFYSGDCDNAGTCTGYQIKFTYDPVTDAVSNASGFGGSCGGFLNPQYNFSYLVPNGNYLGVGGTQTAAGCPDTIQFSGQVTFDDASLSDGVYYGDIMASVLPPTSVAEPDTFALMMAGLLGVWTWSSRRRPAAWFQLRSAFTKEMP